MAKLTLLALALAALVAFATAHTTIVTTTINDEYPLSDRRQCSQRLQGQRLNQCRMFLQQQGQIPYNWGRQQQQQQHPQQQQQQEMLEQCCEELQNVEEQCQCEAVKQVFREAQQEEQQQGPYGSQQTQRLRQKAEILPNVCNLQSRQCRIGTIITTVTESNIDVDRPFGRRSQQCRESEIQRPVNQCQRYVEQQMQAYQQQQQPGRRQQQHQQQRPEGLEECCNELQNVERECQCQAVEEVARRVIRQPQQQQQRHQQQQQGRQQQQQMDIARRVIQNLPNQCNLEVRQCSNIPYGMI